MPRPVAASRCYHSRPHLAILGLVLLVFLTACTRDARLVPPTPQEGMLLYKGQVIPWTAILDFPDFRRDMLNIRENQIRWYLVDIKYEEAQIPIPQDYIEFQFERIYRQFKSPEEPISEGEKRFREQYKIGTEIPEERFRQEIVRMPKVEALLMQQHPVPDELLRQRYDRSSPEEWLGMFGQVYGWTEPEQITFDKLKNELRMMVRQEQLSSYLGPFMNDLVSEAEESGNLTIVRLEGEPAPLQQKSDETDEGLPRDLAQAASRLKDDREGRTTGKKSSDMHRDDVAFVLYGRVFTWKELLDDPLIRMQVQRHVPAVQLLIATDYAFHKEGMQLDMQLLKAERERQLSGIGGESQLEVMLQNQGISEAQWMEMLTREIKVRQLLLAAFPVSEESLQERYKSQSRESWYRAYQPVLGLKSESEMTFARIRDQLYMDAVSNLVAEQRQPYFDTLVNLLKDERVLMASSSGEAGGISMAGAQLRPDSRIIRGLPKLPYAGTSVADALHLPTKGKKVIKHAAPADAGNAAQEEDPHHGHDH